MALKRLWVRGYRSLLDVALEPGQLTVIIGENGSGKTNLYRALRLLSRGAEGRLATTLLAEGGMPSVLFAGERRLGKGEAVRTVIGVEIDEVSYELSLGLPSAAPNDPFVLDPDVKEEVIWVGRKRSRATTIADRAGTTVILHDVDGRPVSYPATLEPAEPLLSQIADPGRYPEVFAVRRHLERWRFYHEFPTGADAPARSPQVGVRTPVLADDGHDLAAAITTIFQIGDGHALRSAVGRAFEGSGVETEVAQGLHALSVSQPGLHRPTRAAELSDGTLRFLYLAAALLTPRPPGLLVLNEPETGLNPAVIEPLSELVTRAAETGQVILTTHSDLLADRLASEGASRVRLTRSAEGATVLGDGGLRGDEATVG